MVIQNDAETSSILVVDDEEPVRKSLNRVLTKLGHQVVTAAGADEALEILRSATPVELMLLDVRMPGRSGLDMVPEAIEVDNDLGILMLSGVNDATTAAICMQRGAMDYLTKPIELTELQQAVGRAIRRRNTNIQSGQISSWLREEVHQRTQELEDQRNQLQQLTVATLEALVNALEAKEPYLIGHSTRVASLAATIAAELTLSDDEVERVRIAGRLHDLGKIGTRSEVLNKQGPLTDEEYEHVKEHVVIGSRILAPLTHLGPVVNFVRHHHERWDGSGYPDGLEGEAIEIGARIVGAAEVFDALTTPRPYHPEMPQPDAVHRMRLLSGTVLDPNITEALAAVVGRRQTLVFLDD